MESLLYLRPDSIGDNVMAAAMLPHLREKYPEASVTVLCQQHIAELYEACPVVDRVIGFDRKKAYDNEVYRDLIVKRLQGVQADLALNPLYSREPLYDLFAIGCGAPNRVAFRGDTCNIPPAMRDENSRLYTRIVRDDPAAKPEIERHREFLEALGCAPSPLTSMIWTTADDERQAEEFFERHNLRPEKTVALFPCGQWRQKIYPHYGKALARICSEQGLEVVALGTQRDSEVAADALTAIGARSVNLSGGTTLRQSAAIIRRCRIGIGADTGTAHIACAVGTPNIVLLGGGHFGRFFPYSPLTSLVSLPLACYHCNWNCRYSRAHCIKDVDPGVVARAFSEAFAGPSATPRVYLQARQSWRPQPDQPVWQDRSMDLTLMPVEIRMVADLPADEAARPSRPASEATGTTLATPP